MAESKPRYAIVDFDQLQSVSCPCGRSQRAFLNVPEAPCTVHRTQILEEAQAHYHQRHTEIYYVLDCEADAAIELDGQRFPLKPGMCVLIPPRVVHRAIGRVTIINVVFPKFDPADEIVL